MVSFTTFTMAAFLAATAFALPGAEKKKSHKYQIAITVYPDSTTCASEPFPHIHHIHEGECKSWGHKAFDSYTYNVQQQEEGADCAVWLYEHHDCKGDFIAAKRSGNCQDVGDLTVAKGVQVLCEKPKKHHKGDDDDDDDDEDDE